LRKTAGKSGEIYPQLWTALEYNQPLYDAVGATRLSGRASYHDLSVPIVGGERAVARIYHRSDTNPSNPALNCNPGGNAEAVFPLGLVVPGDKGVPKGLTESYYKSFAPRIGIAWDPWGRAKTTVRAGWGLFYNPIEQLVLEQFSG